MIYIGVDVGKKGGYAIIDDDLVIAYPYDDKEFVEFMNSICDRKAVACIEQVGAMPGQGVTSMFTFGKSAGFAEGVIRALGIKYQLVRPQIWKKEFGLNTDKQKSIDVCRRLFPDVNLLASSRCRKPHDGMAEALLMAEYARRKM